MSAGVLSFTDNGTAVANISPGTDNGYLVTSGNNNPSVKWDSGDTLKVSAAGATVNAFTGSIATAADFAGAHPCPLLHHGDHRHGRVGHDHQWDAGHRGDGRRPVRRQGRRDYVLGGRLGRHRVHSRAAAPELCQRSDRPRQRDPVPDGHQVGRWQRDGEPRLDEHGRREREDSNSAAPRHLAGPLAGPLATGVKPLPRAGSPDLPRPLQPRRLLPLRPPRARGSAASAAVRFGAARYTYDAVAQRTRAFAALLAEAGVRRGERVLIVLPDAPAVRVGLLRRRSRAARRRDGQPRRAAGAARVPRRATRARPRWSPSRASPRRSARRMRAGAVGREVRRVWSVPDVTALPGDETRRRPCGARATAIVPLPRRATSPPSTRCARPSLIAPRRARHLALHERLDRRAQGQRPLAPRLRLQHRGLRQAHRRLRARTTSPSACRASSSATRPGPTSCSPSRSAPPSGLFSERPTPSRSRAPSRRTGRRSSPTCRRCSASSSTTTRRSRDAGEPGLDLSSVRFSLSAGEALPEALLRRWLERFGSDVYDGIGSAEMFHIYASQPPRRHQARLARQGRRGLRAPHPARGRRGARRARRAPPGEIGVLWVKGDSVSHGYWLDRDKSWKTSSTATGAGRAISSASTRTGTSTSPAAPTSCSR